MSKMETTFRKGRKQRNILLVSLLLTVIMAVGGGFTALAWGGGNWGNWSSAKFTPDIAGNSYSTQDVTVTRSLSEVINFGNDGIFKATSNGMSGVKAFRISSSDMRSGTALQMTLDTTDQHWNKPSSTTKTEFVYKNDSDITYGTFNSLMSQISVSFNPSNTAKTNFGEAKVSITAYSDKNATKAISTWISSQWTYQSTYSCKFIFYDYAKGELDQSSAEMDYKTQYAASYDSTYASDVPDGVRNSVPAYPANKAGGKVSFDLYITEGGASSGTSGSYGYSAQVGYQIKTSNESWDTSISKNYLTETVDGKKQTKTYDLRTWDKSTPIHIDVEGLDYGVTYNIRGIIATDGKTDAPEYTSEMTFRYNTPNISSFNIGSTTQIYQGGNLMNISMLSTFNDTNAVGKTDYEGIDGSEYSGPALKADLYFTTNRKFDTQKDASGNETQIDNAKWYIIGDKTVTKEMTNSDGELENNFAQEWKNVKLPSTLMEVTGKADDNQPIDSKKCAFKLVVTDLYTGYTAVTYSDCFTIDSSAPTAPTVTATDASGKAITLGKDEGRTVGGAGAQVTLKISGAQDGVNNADGVGEGSGVRENSYSMYYLATEDAVGDSTAEVLAAMASLTPTAKGKATYTDWTAAADVLDNSGMPTGESQLTVSKDGYYRVIVHAVDNAGHTSADTEGYFRVDLSAPEKPVAVLAKQTSSGGFEPYDGRTYTQSNVWLFAYSKPLTGKTLGTFEYSTDGGLTWVDIVNDTTVTVNDVSKNLASYRNIANLKTADSALPTVNVYTNGVYTGSGMPQKYQVAVNLSGLGYNDYNSIVVRAKDDLGNTSFLSDAVVMRTTPSDVVVSATLSHDPIEVALALGNTKIKPAQITPDLKNAAAKKINAKYFGESSAEYNLIKNHNCTWTDDVSFTGECNQANCPYKTNPEYYTPAMVNIQGITEESAQKGITDWKRYDHTEFSSEAHSIDEDGYVKLITNDTYNPMASCNGTNVNIPETPSTIGQYIPCKEITDGTPWKGGSATCSRYHHIMDMSTGGTPYEEILFCGTGIDSIQDWLYLSNNQSLPKTFIYTMDVSKCNFHTYVQSGFWFNTTIRMNQGNNWVLSGYRVVLKAGTGKWSLTDCTNTTKSCDVIIEKYTDQLVTSLAETGSGSGTLIASAGLTGTANPIQNFMIITDGDSVTVYKTEGAGNGTKAQLEATTPIIQSNNCPRPTVDGYTIGDTETAGNPYRGDTKCYGFGPVIGYSRHNCCAETRVTFSNISMSMQRGKTLSEVVTEPSWGNGKAKFITNLSDDAVTDFKDPILTSQIQWRLNNDEARYVGWGLESNRSETNAFLLRMAGGDASAEELQKIGMYECSETTRVAYTTQIDEVATYITTQYFMEFGYDVSDGPVKTQVSPADGVKKGTVYTMDNIDNVNFKVEPDKYNTSTANPDFPSGRWYMVHDTNGITTDKDPRDGKYSDALEANITLPGRYTIYFAPDKDAVPDEKDPSDVGKLDPADAVFDFVVNQKPEAQFTATLNASNVLTISDTSYDPDCSAPVYADSLNGRQTYKDASGKIQPVNYSHVQISGIVKREFRYEMLVPNSSNTDLVVVKSTNWSTTSPAGQTLAQLTDNKYSTMPNNGVLTIYERVTDVAAKREAVYDASGNFAGYRYVQIPGTVSNVAQTNVSSGTVEITNPPSAQMSLSNPYMYDTASYSDNAANKKITITRNSSHSQKKPFAVSWAIGIGTTDKDRFISLVKSGNNYIATINGVSETVLTYESGLTSTGTSISGVGTSSTGGTWSVSYSFISKYLKDYKDSLSQGLVIQMTETSWGISAEAANTGGSAGPITDQTARTIFYKTDKNAPTAQVVTAQTKNTSSGTAVYSAYEASNYLEVTDNTKFVEIRATGSEDKEGKLKGYGYYFYKKNASGTVGSEIEWYSMNADGSLSANKGSAKAALQTLPANGSGVITIGKSAMKSTPTDNVNVAIFAYDYQTGQSTITGANQTSLTRIENIKLSISRPMPPAISVTNSMNENVAFIDNVGGFASSYTAEYTGKPDVVTSDLGQFSSTAVTVSFEPRKNTFVNQGGNLVLNSGGTEYYQDIYGSADMTGVANVRYTVKYKATEFEDWWTTKEYEAAHMSAMPVDQIIPSASVLSYSRDGVYEVTAAVVNGSGTVSETRTVTFTIDTTAPTGMRVSFVDENGDPYKPGVCAKEVRVLATGAVDTNADKYQYSEDGGKTWKDIGPVNGTQTHTFTSGEHTVFIRVVDKAGNVMVSDSMLVRVDSEAPVTPPLSLEAAIDTVKVFKDYVLHLNYTAENGSVYSVQNNVTNTKDTEVTVPVDGDVRLEFYPAAGKKLGTILYNDTEIEPTGFDPAKGVYYLDLTKIRSDINLTAIFPDEDMGTSTYSLVRSGMTAMRSAPAMFSTMALFNDEGPGEAGEPDEGGEGTGSGEPEETEEPETRYQVVLNADSDSMDNKVTADLADDGVIAGTKLYVTITTARYYQITGIDVNTESMPLEKDGVSLLEDLGDGKYGYWVEVNADPTFINVHFEKMETRILRVTSSDPDCGKVILTPDRNIVEGVNGEYTVPVGGVVEIQMNAESLYAPKKLTINGEVVAEGTISSTYKYTVPAGEGAIEVSVEFGVADESDSFPVEVSATGEGSITPSGTVYVPGAGSRTFTIKPKEGYKVESLLVTQVVSGDRTTDIDKTSELAPVAGENRTYTYRLEDPVNNTAVKVVFTRQTYPITIEGSNGGVATVNPLTSEPATLSGVPEGVDVEISVKPKDGYKVKSVTITHAGAQYSLGAITSYVVKSLRGNLLIQAEFEQRVVSHTETYHKIKAEANNVKDVDDALAEKPYRFYISDGVNDSAPTDWMAANTITYTSIVLKNGTEILLSPNTKYTVYVQTRDRVGNWSEWIPNTVYTYANMPEAVSAEALDDKGTSTTRSVALEVDINGNPEGTEYQAKVFKNKNQSDMDVANKDVNDGWATLQDGKFIVNGLEPGALYYLQVIARNKDGIPTALSTGDPVSITLSPQAPPINTLYFEEQESPTSPIVLHWSAPDGEVESVQIYRDGTFLVELPPDTLTYSDPEPYKSFADSLVRYSYAYVNKGGPGSSRNAISEEYYNAVTKSETVDADKVEKMEQLEANNSGIFSWTMTYPCYPLPIKNLTDGSAIIASTDGTENSGWITAAMTYDSSVMGRYQKYELVLKAYEVVKDGATGKPLLDENGEEQYKEVDITKWDPNGYHREADGITQKPEVTTVYQESGSIRARATWRNLSTQYKYQIYVQRVCSNGAATSSNLGGEPQGQGIEGMLGKTYYVDKNGYGFYYANDTEPLLDVRTGTWDPDSLADYTAQNDGWDNPLNQGYISFNRSPETALADAEYVYSGNDASKLGTTDDGKQYIMVNQTDKTVSIKMKAWDEDGSGGTIAPYIEAQIADIKSRTTFEKGYEFPSKIQAGDPDYLYEVTFDVSGLPTGVYEDITLKAFDGVTESTKQEKILLVVNRNTPVATVTGGIKRQLEQGTAVNRDSLVTVNSQIIRNAVSAPASLSHVALFAMPDQYESAFGTNSYEELKAWLCNGTNTTALSKAKALLSTEEVTNSKYVNQSTGRLTEDGVNLAILRVAPPVTQYTKITEAQYNSLSAAEQNAYALKEAGTSGTFNYWVELDYALAQNNGLCEWLKKTGTNEVTPQAEAVGKTYTMKLVTNFGGNTTSQSVDFTIKNKPSATILSNKHFGWTDSYQEEYEFYEKEGYTVQKILTDFDKCYDHELVVPEAVEDPAATPAYRRTEDGGYQVYKLTDDEGEVATDRINGTIRVNMGIYSQFQQVGVLVTNDASYRPNDPGSVLADSAYCKEFNVVANQNGTKPITANRDYIFDVTGLTPGQTYYLWSFYQIETDGPKRYDLNYVALTTNNAFKTMSYGFTELSSSHYEKDYKDYGSEGEIIKAEIEGWGDAGTYGSIEVSAEYLLADEFGNLELGEDGQPIKLEGEALAAAKRTVYFNAGTEKATLNFTASTTRGTVQLRIKDTDEQQGHMVVRLALDVVSSQNGYCQISKGRKYMDIFVQDDESPVTSYLLGIVNDDGTGQKLMTEITDSESGKVTSYEYMLRGLQVNYNEMGDLLITYENIGTGDLEDITATVYDDAGKGSVSQKFEAESPSETNLLQSISGAVGTVRVHPVVGLPDGVHEGWVILSAKNMEAEDEVKIHIIQVVGQSTLRGRIFITPDRAPLPTERTGVAKVTLYDYKQITWTQDGEFDRGPVMYTTETDEWGNFEIRNIINNNKNRYQIVVERDGFVTYDSALYASQSPILDLSDGVSRVFTWDLCLRGGDIDADQDIDSTDLNYLTQNYNKYPAMHADDDSAELAKLRRCDLNEDGVINALDRAYLLGNIGFKASKYDYSKLSPDA